MAKDYFQSKEFKDLLKSYEEQLEQGKSIYMDADDFADIADLPRLIRIEASTGDIPNLAANSSAAFCCSGDGVS